jgi:hypothetical protein
MQDNCYTYMHALHYSYGMMQCINTSIRVRVRVHPVCGIIYMVQYISGLDAVSYSEDFHPDPTDTL